MFSNWVWRFVCTCTQSHTPTAQTSASSASFQTWPPVSSSVCLPCFVLPSTSAALPRLPLDLMSSHLPPPSPMLLTIPKHGLSLVHSLNLTLGRANCSSLGSCYFPLPRGLFLSEALRQEERPVAWGQLSPRKRRRRRTGGREGCGVGAHPRICRPGT